MNIDPVNANGDDPTQPMDQYDVTLVAENRRIYFNRLKLADHSPRFKRLIYGKHAIPKGDDILLKEDAKFEVVLAALNLLKLSPDFESVNCALIVRQENYIANSNVEDLLRFAEEYRLVNVTQFCEAFLTDIWGILKPDKFKGISLSAKFGLRETLGKLLVEASASEVITDCTVEPILSVASQFRIAPVINDCVYYLLSFWQMEPDKIVRAVELSAEYGLLRLPWYLLEYGENDAPPITDADMERILDLAKNNLMHDTISRCEEYILREWISKPAKAIRAVEIAREINRPILAVTFIPLAVNRPSSEIFASTAWQDIVNPKYLISLKRQHGLLSIQAPPLFTTTISDLSNDLLSHLFSYLPPKDRLQLSEVCSRFYDISRDEWLDVTDLDLTPVPSARIGAILRQSPNVETIFAKGRLLILADLSHSLINLTSLKLYDISFASSMSVGSEKFTKLWRNAVCHFCNTWAFYAVCTCYDKPKGSVAEQQAATACGESLSDFLENFPQLSDLVLFEPMLTDLSMLPVANFLPLALRASLGDTLTHLFWHSAKFGNHLEAPAFCQSLTALPKLECLSLDVRLLLDFVDAQFLAVQAIYGDIRRAFESLVRLRELNIADLRVISRSGDDFEGVPYGLERVLLRLPKLEVLLLDNHSGFLDHDDVAEMIEHHSTLRILLLSEIADHEVWALQHFEQAHGIAIEKILLPARKRFPTGGGGVPLPDLHIFVGDQISRYFAFASSPAAVSKVHPLDLPMPEFLEKSEVAEIFEGVWLAKMIAEAASCGAELLGQFYATTPSVTSVDQEKEEQ